MVIVRSFLVILVCLDDRCSDLVGCSWSDFVGLIFVGVAVGVVVVMLVFDCYHFDCCHFGLMRSVWFRCWYQLIDDVPRRVGSAFWRCALMICCGSVL